MLTTFCVFPEVAPLCQSSFLDRDQNQVSDVSTVRRRLSSFMYARVKTSPVSTSWIIAGISPCSSNLTIHLQSIIEHSPRDFSGSPSCRRLRVRHNGTTRQQEQRIGRAPCRER